MSAPLSFLVAAGRRLEYRWIPAACRDAPPLVFLHEGLGSTARWGDFRGIERARAEYDTGRLRGKLQPWHEDVDATFRGWADLWLLPGFRAWNIERMLPGIRCPVLVIQGEEDRYGTAAQLEAIERGASGPVKRMMLAGCGHAPHAEQPEIVLPAMVRFIATLPPVHRRG